MYWIGNDGNVHFIDLGTTLKETNLITSSSQFLSGDISGFVLDLVESQFVYTNASRILQSKIGRGIVQMTDFPAATNPLSLLVTFAGEILTYSPPTRRFTSYEHGMKNSEVSFNTGRPPVTAMILVRATSQPLPGENRK